MARAVLLRRALFTVSLVGLSAALGSYFLWHADQGQRGRGAKQALKGQIVTLRGELASLEAERANWERRVGQMHHERVDRDLLDERVRAVLNSAHPSDVVIVLDRR